MNPLEAILQALNLSTRIKTREQLIAFLTMLALIAWLFTLVFEERNKRLVVDRDIETQINIVQMRLSVATIAVFEFSAHNNQLDPVWTWDDDVRSDALTELYRLEPNKTGDRRDLFQQLRQGDCDTDKAIARDENGVLLPGLVCPIFRRGKLIGAIAGAYYTMPLKDSLGEVEPDASELYKLGTYLID